MYALIENLKSQLSNYMKDILISKLKESYAYEENYNTYKEIVATKEPPLCTLNNNDKEINYSSYEEICSTNCYVKEDSNSYGVKTDDDKEVLDKIFETFEIGNKIKKERLRQTKRSFTIVIY